MMTLNELNRANSYLYYTDKGVIHNYLDTYDKLFTPYRFKRVNIFEVGYQHGGSCKLWERYFPEAMIRSIDIDNCVPEPVSSRIRVDIMDANDLTADYFSDFPPDIAIDDGSHLIDDQLRFAKMMLPVINPGGLLIVEDIQNLAKDKRKFKRLGHPFMVVDLRKSGRYDDVLIIFKK